VSESTLETFRPKCSALVPERARGSTARSYLQEVLRRHEGRISDAAAHAGVERESFYRLLRRFGVDSDTRGGKR